MDQTSIAVPSPNMDKSIINKFKYAIKANCTFLNFQRNNGFLNTFIEYYDNKLTEYSLTTPL